MRKFKLIKEFPLSPAKGTIATFKTMQEEIEGIYDMGAIPNLILTDCTQFPEFWEEVKEQEFEILEFTAQVTGLKHVLREDGKYNPNGLSKETLLEHSVLPLQITKVERLSDNEDFSIGDKVTYNYKANYAPWIIDNFLLRSDGKILARSKSNSICEIVSEIKKATDPLFVTEDNVEIFEGDTPFLWKVTDDFDIVYDHYEITEGYKFFIKGRTFSTREAAKKWIDENKPIYSKKEIQEALSKVYLSTTNGTFINESLFRQCLGL